MAEIPEINTYTPMNLSDEAKIAIGKVFEHFFPEKRQEVKVGDILKFEKPLHWWDKKFLDAGGYYVVTKEQIFSNQPETICVQLKCPPNGSYGYGKLADYDIPFEVVGSVMK